MQKVTSKNGGLEISLFKDESIEIEFKNSKNVSIEIKPVDPTNSLTPLGALYKIGLYKSEEKVKNIPFEYDSAWIMFNGKILKKGEEYSKYMRTHPKD
ncbi:MAG: hypothetical protein KJ949_03255 [Nanoarchaeota archaeon]|nr:hypothetical protein [Nanoarchaeota archaeon]MBU4308476.1 hypothetical protein [Nanoarchaeota archaeon]